MCMFNLEPAAFLPWLQRCSQRVDSFVTEHDEAVTKIAAENSGTAWLFFVNLTQKSPIVGVSKMGK